MQHDPGFVWRLEFDDGIASVGVTDIDSDAIEFKTPTRSIVTVSVIPFFLLSGMILCALRSTETSFGSSSGPVRKVIAWPGPLISETTNPESDRSIRARKGSSRHRSLLRRCREQIRRITDVHVALQVLAASACSKAHW